MNTTSELSCDMSIIGSGAAGLSLVLRLAEKHQVIVLSKGPVSESSTFYAQRGIVAVFDEADSIDPHVEDTLIAGAGLCDRYAVKSVTSSVCTCVQWPVDQDVLFDIQVQPNGEEGYRPTREGDHSHRRIPHAADATGKEIEATLASQAQNHPNIRVLERSNAIDLIVSDKIGLSGMRRVAGAWIRNYNKEAVEACHAKSVMLATGGALKVYQYTTNLDTPSGDGIVMAWRAGCRVANLEFNQLHPTALYHPQVCNFLLTEALRGEGVYLRRPDGSRLMSNFDECGELAPHDIVVRATDYEMKRLGADCMFLNISHKPEEFTRQHFPMIYEKLLGLDIDLTEEPIPIVPATHYTCGSVMMGDFGRTDVDGLYAVGKVSHTDLYGTNRMTSNPLLECLVYGWSAAEDIDRRMSYARGVSTLLGWDESRVENLDELVAVQHNWHELRLFVWDYVGIMRTTKRLERALRHVTMLQQEIDEYYTHFRMSNNLLELRNLVQVAELIVRCAMMYKESRGLHYTLDYPKQFPEAGPSILSPLSHHINR